MGNPRWGNTGDYPPRTKVYISGSSTPVTMTDETYSKLLHSYQGSASGHLSPLWDYGSSGSHNYILRGLEDDAGDHSFHDVMVMFDHFYSNQNEGDGYSEYEAMTLDIFSIGSLLKFIHYYEGYSDLETLRHIFETQANRISVEGEYYGGENRFYSMCIVREKIPSSEGGKEIWFHCDGYTNNEQRIGSPTDAWTTILLKRELAGEVFVFGEYGKLRVESYYANKKLLIYLPTGTNKNVTFKVPSPIKDRSNDTVYNFWKWEWTNTSGQKVTLGTDNPHTFNDIPSNIAGITVAYKRTT